MALRVWLPLNNDLRQQGSKPGAATTVGTVALDANGKLGSCHVVNGSRIVIPIETVNDLPQGHEMSVTCWFNIVAWKGSYDCLWHLGNGNGGWTANRFTLWQNNTTHKLILTLSDGSTTNNANACTTTTFETGTWYHIACTYKSGTLKIYVNGVLESTTTPAMQPKLTNITAFNLGGTGASYYSNAKLNDFRMYDHCLSAKEVKLISQALIAHYTFNDCCESTVNYFTPASSVGLSNNVSSSDWRLERPDINTFKITALVNNPSYGTYGNIVEGLGTGVSAAANQSMTQSCEIVDFKGSLSRIYPGSGGFGSIVGYGEYKGRIYRTITHNQAWGHNFVIRTSSQSNIKAGDYLIIRNLQIELKNHPTDFVNGTRNSNIFYDTSGYMNNGVITGNFQTNYISPRYQIANIFDTSTAINIGSQFATAGTIAMWIKPTVQSGIFFIDDSSGTALACGFYQSDKLIISRGTKNMYNSSIIPLNEWTHFCIVNEGNPFKIYINGELSTSILDTTQSWSPSVTNFAIGHRNGGDHFQGSMSDFRIYATILNAADIKELYQTSMEIDSSGNILPRVLTS